MTQGRGFYTPPRGWVGDVIPFAFEGRANLFYLHETRDQEHTGTPWRHLSTKDFVDFTDHGCAIPSGGPDAADFNAYTGSVIFADGAHHLYYTGHNPRRLGPDGLPLQIVMKARSDDGMATWVKQPELAFGATDGYEPSDWRDPFVFQVPGATEWRMLVTARDTVGAERRRGVIAQLRSDDLEHWTPVDPLYAPTRYTALECPEVFEWQGWWYLVYSEFTDGFCTRYRMARSPEGPWVRPEFDTIDGRGFYAAKSLSLHGRRFFIGWIPTKRGSRDDGDYEWAGTLSTLEATQLQDGTLAFSTPSEIQESFSTASPGKAEKLFGSRAVTVSAPQGYDVAMSSFSLPSAVRLSATVEFDGSLESCGVLVRASADGDDHYAIRLEPSRQRVVFDRWPRPRTGSHQWQISGDVPFAVELERPCRLEPGLHHIDIIADGDTLVTTIDASTVLSARVYDRRDGHVGLFASEGSARFRNIEVSTMGSGNEAGASQ